MSLDARPLQSPAQFLLSSQPLPPLVQVSFRMADPSGAPPQPGPNDTSTAILRPKKSYVYPIFPYHFRSDVLCSPNRLIVDEASSDDNSGRHLVVSDVVIVIRTPS